MGMFFCVVIFVIVIVALYKTMQNDTVQILDEEYAERIAKLRQKVKKEREKTQYIFDSVYGNKDKIEKEKLQSDELMVDEYRGKVYNLIKERIGQDKCVFLHPLHDNSVILDKLNNLPNELPLKANYLTPEEIDIKLKSLDFNDITKFIEAKKSGDKGKNYFLNNENESCSTEEIAKEYYNSQGYIVLRAELDFWQMLFCLLFFEEIYCKYWDVTSDIPFDYYNGCFYFMRADFIKAKLEKIKNSKKLKDFVISQFNDFGKFPSRLLYPTGKTFGADILQSDVITMLFDYIPNDVFVKIFSRYAQYPSEYRSGMPDLIVFNESGYKLVEVKRLKEKIRYEQTEWISYMKENNIPVEILRVKGI